MAVINGDYVTLTVDELTRLMQQNTAKFLLEENKISKNKFNQGDERLVYYKLQDINERN